MLSPLLLPLPILLLPILILSILVFVSRGHCGPDGHFFLHADS